MANPHVLHLHIVLCCFHIDGHLIPICCYSIIETVLTLKEKGKTVENCGNSHFFMLVTVHGWPAVKHYYKPDIRCHQT